MIKLCVFDMDGLLLETERYVYLKTGLEASKKAGFPVTKEFLTSIMGGGWSEYKGHFIEEYGEDYPFDEYWKYFWPEVEHLINDTAIPLRPGAKEILQYCKDNNIMTAVATSSHLDVARKCLKNSGIDEYFSFYMTGDMVEHSKPDPEIFLRTIEHFPVDKSEALVFEDGHNGSQAAIRGGCRYVLVEDIAFVSDEDREKADLCTDTLLKAIDFIRKENEGTFGI